MKIKHNNFHILYWVMLIAIILIGCSGRRPEATDTVFPMKNTSSPTSNITITDLREETAITATVTLHPTNGLDLSGELLFISQMGEDHSPRVYKGDINGSEFTMLTDDIIAIRHAHWSPNGEKIAYITFSGRVDINGFPDGESLRVVDTTGATSNTLLSYGNLGGYTGYEDNISWSPDQTKIVYSDYISEYGGDLFIVWMDGGIKRLTITNEDEETPRWINNEEILYYSYTMNDEENINIMNITTQETRTLNYEPENYEIISISTQCNKLIIRKKDDKSVVMKDFVTDDIQATSIILHNIRTDTIKISPNCLFMAYNNGNMNILNIIENKILISAEDVSSYAQPIWAPDSKRVIFNVPGGMTLIDINGMRKDIKVNYDVEVVEWRPI